VLVAVAHAATYVLVTGHAYGASYSQQIVRPPGVLYADRGYIWYVPGWAKAGPDAVYNYTSLRSTSSGGATWVTFTTTYVLSNGYAYGGVVGSFINVAAGSSASASSSSGAMAIAIISAKYYGSAYFRCDVSVSSATTVYRVAILFNSTWAAIQYWAFSVSSSGWDSTVSSAVSVALNGVYVYICLVRSTVSILGVGSAGVYSTASSSSSSYYVGTHYYVNAFATSGDTVYTTYTSTAVQFATVASLYSVAPNGTTYPGRFAIAPLGVFYFATMTLYSTVAAASIAPADCPPNVYVYPPSYSVVDGGRYVACTSVAPPSGYQYSVAPLLQTGAIPTHFTFNITTFDPATGAVVNRNITYVTSRGYSASFPSGARVAWWMSDVVTVYVPNACPMPVSPTASGRFAGYVPSPSSGYAVYVPLQAPRPVPHLRITAIGASNYTLAFRDATASYSCGSVPTGTLYLAYPPGSWMVLNLTAHARYTAWILQRYPASLVTSNVTAYADGSRMWLNVTAPTGDYLGNFTIGTTAAAYLGPPVLTQVAFSVSPYVTGRGPAAVSTSVKLSFPNGESSPTFALTFAKLYYVPTTAVVYLGNIVFFPAIAGPLGVEYIVFPSSSSIATATIYATTRDIYVSQYATGMTYMGLLTQYYTPGKWAWVTGAVYSAIVATQFAPATVAYPPELSNTIAMLAFLNTASGASYTAATPLQPYIYVVIGGVVTASQKQVVYVRWGDPQPLPNVGPPPPAAAPITISLLGPLGIIAAGALGAIGIYMVRMSEELWKTLAVLGAFVLIVGVVVGNTGLVAGGALMIAASLAMHRMKSE